MLLVALFAELSRSDQPAEARQCSSTRFAPLPALRIPHQPLGTYARTSPTIPRLLRSWAGQEKELPRKASMHLTQTGVGVQHLGVEGSSCLPRRKQASPRRTGITSFCMRLPKKGRQHEEVKRCDTRMHWHRHPAWRLRVRDISNAGRHEVCNIHGLPWSPTVQR